MRKTRRPRKPRRPMRYAEEHRWKISLLNEFIAKHGWSELRAGTVVPPGVKLFPWVHNRRQDYRSGEISDWLVAECEAIPGWTWDPLRDRHRRNVDSLRTFVREHGWEELTVETEVEGVLLSHWAVSRRQEYKRGVLARWLIDALEAIPGWSWDPRTTNHASNLRELRGHVARHGWSSINQATISRRGISIGKWANHVRVLRRQGTLPRWLEAAVETIPGWTWEPRLARQGRRVALLRTFVEKHGWDRVNHRLVIKGVLIGAWLTNCRGRYAGGTLSKQTILGLEAIHGWAW